MIAKKVVTNILRGNKCVFCKSYKTYKLKDKRIKCGNCKQKYSINKIKKELNILYYFYIDISARKASRELGLSYRTVHSKYMSYRYKIADYLHEQFKKLGGEVEMDESYFGGKRKGKRGRGAYNKRLCSVYWNAMAKSIQRSYPMSPRRH